MLPVLSLIRTYVVENKPKKMRCWFWILIFFTSKDLYEQKNAVSKESIQQLLLTISGVSLNIINHYMRFLSRKLSKRGQPESVRSYNSISSKPVHSLMRGPPSLGRRCPGVTSQPDELVASTLAAGVASIASVYIRIELYLGQPIFSAQMSY